MLLVDDDEAGLREFHFLFEQGMRADDELRVSLRDVAANLALAVGFQRAGQQNNSVAGVLEDFARGKIMLLRENFGGGHQCYLVAVFDGDDRRLKSDDSLSRTDVPLEQASHRMRLLHVIGNLFQNSLLCGRRMKRENLLDRLPDSVVQLKGNSRLRFLLSALPFQAQLGKK